MVKKSGTEDDFDLDIIGCALLTPLNATIFAYPYAEGSYSISPLQDSSVMSKV